MTINIRSIQRLRDMAQDAREIASDLNGTVERCDGCNQKRAKNENEWRAMHRTLKFAERAEQIADFMEKALKERSRGGCDMT